MSDIEKARSLMRLASNDLMALRGMQDGSVFVDAIFGFHAQQSAEKALKAWLTANNVAFPLTHELTRLIDLLEAAGENIDPLLVLAKYTVFAVQARYEEGFLSLDEALDRNEVIAEIDSLLTIVNARINADMR